MKELRISPVLGIRNSQSFQPLELDNDNSHNFNPGPDHSNFRMPAAVPRTTYVRPGGYFPPTGGGGVRRRSAGSSGGNGVAPRRRRLFSNFKQKAKQIKVKIPRVQDVNTIDRYSRLLFPVLFVLFNASYWAVYTLT